VSVAAATGRSRPLLGFRTVELAARKEGFRGAGRRHQAGRRRVYMLGLALDHLGEDSGGGGAIALAGLIRRRCEALQRLAEQQEGPADG
jgi:hypothetical protein